MSRRVGSLVGAVGVLALGGAVQSAGASTDGAAAIEPITIATRDSVLSRGQPFVVVFGSLAGGKPDQPVMLEGKECGLAGAGFRRWGPVTHTRAGGGWSTQAFIQTTTELRARSGSAVSAVLTVRARANVFLRPRGTAGTFEVTVGGVANFWRKRVEIQRYDRRVGTWSRLRSFVLGPSEGGYSSVEFRAGVPRGTLIRAVFPLSQARPCYLAGYSTQLRT